jgi:hypothetical protein
MLKSKYSALFLIIFSMLLVTTACGSQVEAKAPAVAPEPTPTLVAVGASIDKPVPYGYDIILQDVVLRVDEIMRSDSTVLTDQDGSSILDDGQEFILIRITSQCVKPGQDLCFISPADFQVYDPSGSAITAESDLSGLNELYTAAEFGSGTSKKGLLAIKVQKGQSYPIMSYTQFNGSEIFLSLSY